MIIPPGQVWAISPGTAETGPGLLNAKFR